MAYSGISSSLRLPARLAGFKPVHPKKNPLQGLCREG
jgi:hypothetical protein